ncbi:MAG: UDP-2,3-diacylglucosamine diphosphatase [candidate division Zixibacteria bacterium]|nr:UDP-2,3-diacylglucosamine diphosphatase [candidate division Zixibacteria bacterium]
MALYIFSDAHLGADNDDAEAAKLAKIGLLFERVKADGDRLIVLGDLFDFWFEYRHAIPKEHHRVLFMMTELIGRGIKIDYVSGNHDFWLGDFFSTQMQISLHRDFLDLDYDGRRLHLIHGDGLARADRGYRLLKRILRSPLNIWLYRKLTPDWAMPLAKYVSGSSRNYTSRRDRRFAEDYTRYARRKLKEGYDVVAIGHLHIPVYTEHEDGVYINTGDFINHFSYARMSEGKITLEYLQ